MDSCFKTKNEIETDNFSFLYYSNSNTELFPIFGIPPPIIMTNTTISSDEIIATNDEIHFLTEKILNLSRRIQEYSNRIIEISTEYFKNANGKRQKYFN